MATSVSPSARAGEGPDDLAALAARRDELRKRRAALVLARRAEEAEAAALAVITRAITATRRDRDATRSTSLQRHRASFEQLMADVERVGLLVARTGRRVIDLDLAEDDPIQRRAEKASRTGLTALQKLSDDLRVVAAIEGSRDGQG